MNVAIIDYGMGNLISVKRAFEECGAEVSVALKPHELYSASHIVLPGVGSFADGMASLSRMGWVDAIHEIASRNTASFLGICLGMQLLATHGTEGGLTDGLGLIPGMVDKFKSTELNERIPHVGWNEIWQKDSFHPLLTHIENRSDFYFVHSYHFIPESKDSILATTPYCGEFVSLVASHRVFGAQFHPEKSQKSGFQFIRNFLSL